MFPRSARRRRRRALVALVVVVMLIGGIAVAAVYGWNQLTRHQLTADSCQVVGASSVAVSASPVPSETFSMDPDQLLNASIIADVAMRRALPERAVVIALATAQQESKLRNLDYGDADSVGLFQQRPSQGWGPADDLTQPTYAAGKFYDALLKVPNWQQLAVGEAAQDVQRSAFPEAYASWEPRATALAGALTGTTASQLTCRLVHPGVSAGATSPAASPTSSAQASPPPTSAAGAAQAVTAGLLSDLVIAAPVVTPTGARTTTVTVLGLGATATGTDATAQHRDAVVAAWAIAHAAADGVVAVVVGDQEWRPDRHGWQRAKKPLAGGRVVITVGQNT
jgi:hypothetical protein